MNAIVITKCSLPFQQNKYFLFGYLLNLLGTFTLLTKHKSAKCSTAVVCCDLIISLCSYKLFL